MEVQEMVLEIKYVRVIEYKVELKTMDVEMIKNKQKTENLKDKEKMEHMIKYIKVIGAPDHRPLSLTHYHHHHPGQHQISILQHVRICEDLGRGEVRAQPKSRA